MKYFKISFIANYLIIMDNCMSKIALNIFNPPAEILIIYRETYKLYWKVHRFVYYLLPLNFFPLYFKLCIMQVYAVCPILMRHLRD